MFNFLKLFKRKPPVAKGPIGMEETAGYGIARGYQKTNKDGEQETVIIGEKYPLRGHSRENVLHGKLRLISGNIKEGLRILALAKKEMIPRENLKLPVRAFFDVCDMFMAAEKSDRAPEKDVFGSMGLKQKWEFLKKFGCYLLEDDDAYCFRFQLFIEAMAQRIKKIRLSKGDKYYFHSRPDFDWRLFDKLNKKR